MTTIGTITPGALPLDAHNGQAHVKPGEPALEPVRAYIETMRMAAQSALDDASQMRELTAKAKIIAGGLAPLVGEWRERLATPEGAALRAELATLRTELVAIQRSRSLPKPLRATVTHLLNCDALRVCCGEVPIPPPASDVIAHEGRQRTSLLDDTSSSSSLSKLAFGAHVVLSGVVAAQVGADVVGAGGTGAIALSAALTAACARLGWSLADATSYVTHAFFDQVNPAKLPGWLRNVALIFQEHHEQPATITQGTFWEMTGRITPVSVVLLGMTAACDPGLALGGLMLGFTTGGILAQESHKLSHKGKASRATRVMRRLGLFMTPQDHGMHHARPRNATYATLSGETNRPLDALGVGELVERFIASRRLGFEDGETTHWHVEERRAAASRVNRDPASRGD